MKQRILVAVVGVPALLAVLCAAPDWATLALLMGLCIIASHELLAAVLPPEKTRRWWGLAATLAVFVVANVYFSHERFAGTAAAELMPWLVAALVVVVFLCMVLEYGKKEEMDFTALCAILVAGAAIPLALSCLLRLRMLEHGAGLVLIPLVAAFMSDTMALFGGMLFGKTKLAPVVSPKKTREGAVSGLVGGMVGMVLYRIIFFLCTEVPLHIGVTETGTARMGTIKSAMGIGALLCQGIGDTMRVSLTADPVQEVLTAKDILKAAGLRKTGVNIIACPTCGRTRIDLIGLANQVEQALAACEKPITVAVMGCVVNGPGEAREADIGIAGGDGCGILFVRGKQLKKLPYDELLPTLLEYIEKL